ncbi:hypothetical protein Y032_0042g673 [Ancylostoma ceylanicum]|uniref:Transthyretin-like family protein n=1 Tax=Ancylostoma ceylanicum TaxID=53326 RepID=A0A016UFH0_9BILA|nr:hypothetical protein Y032_0042g673 [Ancylostoma ceylanicum]
MRVLIFLLYMSSYYGVLGLFNLKQSAGVKGKLHCNGQPAKGVEVQLLEKEPCMILTNVSSNNLLETYLIESAVIFSVFDALMAEGRTDTNGFFKLGGSADEVTSIEPELVIHHKCNYKNPPEEKRTGSVSV